MASVALVAWVCGLGACGFSGPSQPAPAAGLELAQVTRPGPVLAPLQAGGQSDHAGLAAHLAGVLGARALGPHVGVAVDDLDSGKALLRLRGRDVFTPASTVKLLTTTAALEVLGPDHRFTTSTVLAGRTVFLVGGGDPLLARRAPPPEEATETYPLPATVENLARKTARKLHERGVREVRVAADAGMFSGPSTSPSWEPSYVPSDVVSPISALWVDEGRVRAGFAERSTDPVAAAAAAFVGGLRRHGITVRGAAALAAVAPPVADSLAQVESAPLARIVEHVLELSDNEAAEVLLRQTAVGAGFPASFSGGVKAVHQTLTKLGVDLSSATIHDGSGLSRDDALRLSTLAKVLETAADPAHPELRAVVAGLPVAGFSGTLAYRFVDRGTSASLGVVRAKTGTLTGVTVYAGVAQARDGDLLAFVADADRVRPVDTLRARTALDRIASALATCGC